LPSSSTLAPAEQLMLNQRIPLSPRNTVVLPSITSPKHTPVKPTPVHKRHTAASANWSRRDESPRLELTPRERAIERTRARFERQARVPFHDDSPRERTPLGGSPFLAEGQAQRPEIMAMSDELAMHHEVLKEKLHTRFKSFRKAFRLMDADKSNTCDVREVREGLTRMFNLEHIPQAHMDRLTELMDTSGDGVVRLDEFAHFFSTHHRPQSAVNVRRENALRKARPDSSPSRGRF